MSNVTKTMTNWQRFWVFGVVFFGGGEGRGCPFDVEFWGFFSFIGTIYIGESPRIKSTLHSYLPFVSKL